MALSTSTDVLTLAWLSASPAASGEPPTNWVQVGILVAVIAVASAVMGWIGWKKSG